MGNGRRLFLPLALTLCILVATAGSPSGRALALDLLSGAVDLVISSMTITEERSLIVDFSAPYFVTGQVIVARTDGGRIDAKGDLTGIVLAAEVNTTSFEAAQSLPGAVVLGTKSKADAFAALLAGEIDGVVTDEPFARHQVSAHPDILHIAEQPISVEAYGIAVRKGDSELLARINQGLAAIRADGTYVAIYDRWFGRP